MTYHGEIQVQFHQIAIDEPSGRNFHAICFELTPCLVGDFSNTCNPLLHSMQHTSIWVKPFSKRHCTTQTNCRTRLYKGKPMRAPGCTRQVMLVPGIRLAAWACMPSKNVYCSAVNGVKDPIAPPCVQNSSDRGGGDLLWTHRPTQCYYPHGSPGMESIDTRSVTCHMGSLAQTQWHRQCLYPSETSITESMSTDSGTIYKKSLSWNLQEEKRRR